MHICRNKADIRATVSAWRTTGETVGFVPTMGALHEGHLTLVREARTACSKVVASIFVNPTQFGEAADLENYPRTEAADLAALQAAGVDAVFLPTVDEMYPAGATTIVEVEGLSSVLMGAVRPGHFRGVTTVVTKLFNIVRPDHAFFGQKDYQQLAIIRQMVRDLDVPIEITGVPVVREDDGLAMSSRNVRLTAEHRAQAPAIHRALAWAAERATSGPVTIADLDQGIRALLANAPAGQIEAIDIQDAATLADLTGPLTRPAVILPAVRFGEILLIDVMPITPAHGDIA